LPRVDVLNIHAEAILLRTRPFKDESLMKVLVSFFSVILIGRRNLRGCFPSSQELMNKLAKFISLLPRRDDESDTIVRVSSGEVSQITNLEIKGNG